MINEPSHYVNLDFSTSDHITLGDEENAQNSSTHSNVIHDEYNTNPYEENMQ